MADDAADPFVADQVPADPPRLDIPWRVVPTDAAQHLRRLEARLAAVQARRTAGGAARRSRPRPDANALIRPLTEVELIALEGSGRAAGQDEPDRGENAPLLTDPRDETDDGAMDRQPGASDDDDGGAAQQRTRLQQYAAWLASSVDRQRRVGNDADADDNGSSDADTSANTTDDADALSLADCELDDDSNQDQNHNGDDVGGVSTAGA